MSQLMPGEFSSQFLSGGVVQWLINEVNRHWARLVLGWVTICWRVNHLGT